MARGREDAADIEGRIARASAHDVSGGDVITISNDSERDVAIAAMTDALEAASSLEWEASE
jgi:ribose 1,5-bisphosphokinase PhnN